MNKTYIIIGTSAAGIGAAYRLRMLDAEARILCISDEPETPYNKCFIVDYVSGERTEQQTYTLTPERAQQKNIECILGVRVQNINSDERTIECSDGTMHAYDALFIGTGCSPFTPPVFANPGIQARQATPGRPIKNISLDGVYSFYTLRDAQKLNAILHIKKPRIAVIIGAGLTGLEVADALQQRGLQVHVVERASHVLPYHVDVSGAAYIHAAMQKKGVTLHTNVSVTEILEKRGSVSGVRLSDGRTIDTDLVVYAVGARPNSQLAQNAGIKTRDGYIAVDDYMRTSVDHIFAGGDVCVTKHILTGALVPSTTWPDAMQQGMIAAYNMVGHNKPYNGIIGEVRSAFFDLEFVACGVLQGDVRSETEVTTVYHQRCVYANNTLTGYVVIGELFTASKLRRTLLSQ